MKMKAATGLPVLTLAFLMTSFAGLLLEPPPAHASPELAPATSIAAQATAKPTSPALLPNAASTTVPSQTVHARAVAPKLPTRLPILGLGIDVGVPDGANISVLARPSAWSRLQLAVGNNGMSYGWRLGAALLPFRDGPAAVVEYGHYRDGNANRIAGKLIGSSFQPSPLFERVGYDYVNLQLGINFGYRRVVFFIQGGLSVVRGQIHNATQALQQQTSGLTGTEVAVKSDPTIKATGFAGKLGLITYVW
jgi:hypothetical protein